MKKTRMWKLILFSFFAILLLGSCQKEVPSFTALVQSEDWQGLHRAAKKEFSTTYQSGSLYYLALAQAELHEQEQALRSLALYREIAGESGISTAARTLMITLAAEQGDMELVASQASVLQKMGALPDHLATAYYQALMSLGKTQEASAVFTAYLKERVDAREYALLLLEAEAPLEQLREALAPLDAAEVLTLFQTVAERDHDVSWAKTLVSLAQEYEKRDLQEHERIQLYRTLASLCVQADLRVLANKYQSLSKQ
ncbi:MAG: hypothetical protein AB7D92_01675 [Sphaerochaeta sp.]